MSTLNASMITARLDRLPMGRELWRLIVLLSLGACFEIYDLLQTAYLTPGLIRAGIFKEAAGLFGLTDQAMFISVTFAGLFVGTLLFAPVADRFGRRTIFTLSLLWYTAASIGMGLQHTASGVDLWRFVGGVGIGIEIVTIDAYISELAPKDVRGRAFAVNQFIQFLAVPVLAFSAWALVPRAPLHVAGWRWVVFLGSIGAVVVWFIRRRLPESPRWLAQHGRLLAAEQAVAALEARIEARLGHKLPAPESGQLVAHHETARLADIWRPPYRGRTLMLVGFNFFQTIGFYGFGNWVPTLIAAQGASVTRSLQYAAVIAIANPTGPLLCTLIADRVERKWQIISAAIGTATFGLLFARQTAPPFLILCGVMITLSNNLLSYAYHAYQAELYPTRIRARAVGFVYSWSRLSTVCTSLLIGFFLAHFGPIGVFAFIAGSMLVCVFLIGAFGPRTSGLALEKISA